jgi:hypothetical protein
MVVHSLASGSASIAALFLAGYGPIGPAGDVDGDAIGVTRSH